jgi:hypothetical protein
VHTDSQIIVAADVLPGDAGDATGVLGLVEEAEANSGQSVAETVGDCAYGGGPTRQAFADAGRELVAKAPQESVRDGHFPKSAFHIDVDNGSVTCPEGHTSTISVATQSLP